MALLLFDLDGTLVDSIDGLAYSMNLVLESYGFPVHSSKRYQSFVGNGIEKLVERALPDGSKGLTKEVFPLMLESYRQHYNVGLKAYEGIYKMLDALVAGGHRLMLITNKHQEMAEWIMSDMFSRYPFETIIGRGERFASKPNPEALIYAMKQTGYQSRDVYMIGDTEADIMAARRAGVHEMVVSWGFRSKADLEAYEPTCLLDHPMDIVTYLNDIITEGESE